MSDGNKFEIIAPFSENRGISLLLKYNKVHILNKCCTSAIFDCLSLMCIKNSRIPVIIERRDGIRNVIDCLRFHKDEYHLVYRVLQVAKYLATNKSNLAKFSLSGTFLPVLHGIFEKFGDARGPDFFILLCQLCESLAFHNPTRRNMQNMKFVDTIHGKRSTFKDNRDCVRAVKICIAQVASLV